MLLIDKLILLAGNELRMLSTNAVSTENYNTDIINYKLTNLNLKKNNDLIKTQDHKPTIA
jgi:hypothetical protein